ELDPCLGWVHLERGRLLTGAGRDQEALADHDQALELEPDHAPSFLHRALLRPFAGSLEDAPADLDSAAELASSVP
ncbi:hypothetical protein, partial [Amycolatopsis sp. WAC 04197]|uniref:hypothetical protein n=1 Tax=Amycolatopsis sp. WAC 04197 TaxID=2203199 RepID=UPI0018F7B654